jgi:hypothetical protein
MIRVPPWLYAAAEGRDACQKRKRNPAEGSTLLRWR